MDSAEPPYTHAVETPHARTEIERPMHAIVAVKSLRSAKSRLAGELDSDARADLVLAMLHDTLATVAAVSAIDSVTVVTPDPTVAALAYSVGVTVYADPAPDAARTNGATPRTEETLNAALSAAAADIRAKRGVVDLVVLQADLPAMQPSELTEAVAAAEAADVQSSSITTAPALPHCLRAAKARSTLGSGRNPHLDMPIQVLVHSTANGRDCAPTSTPMPISALCEHWE